MDTSWASEVVEQWIANCCDRLTLCRWIGRCKLRLQALPAQPYTDISSGDRIAIDGTHYRVDRITREQSAEHKAPRAITIHLVHENDWVPF